jgi:hypothetical protein
MTRSGLRARVPILVTLLAIALISSGVIHAQQVKPNQLLVFISAVDKGGAPVTDLKAEEIVYTESNNPGKVVSLDRHSLPIKLTIAVDNGSASQPALASLREGLHGMVNALPQDLEVTLITMSQPQTVVRPTTDRAQITQGIDRFAAESRAVAKFSETLVEYADRIDKDFRDKKLTYAPRLVVVATPTPELETVQPDTLQKALNTLQARGARVSAIMVTTTPTNTDSVANLTQGRQAVIAAAIAKGSQGRFETMVAFKDLATVLPAWGKEIAQSHVKQTMQYRAVIDRPGGATGALNNLGLRLTRPGAEGNVSPNGLFP